MRFSISCLLVISAASCKPAAERAAPTSEVAEDKPPAAPPERWKIKCHRGASHEAPENTITAVKLCFERGGLASEIDVRLSSDSVPVVIHDEDTARVAGVARKVSEQTAAELATLDVGSWKHSRFRGERLPTLASVIAVVPEDAILFVEAKDGFRSVPAILALIEASGRTNIAIESFDLDVLALVRKRAPHLAAHLTVGTKRDESGRFLAIKPSVAKAAADFGFSGLSVDARGLTEALAHAAEAAGLELAVWTINDPADARRLRALPVTWIETDRPGAIAAARD